ncbi:hypothetical protein RIR_jg21074.t1 [Rhizophagus irregularis DAOM 181602=DAOM 197198]|uniref:Uncharacterized protein n=1 Tax=Rhizophagus irregularis (strain DAOM 181602 / DAOM 197198 / MUCL 43194) TaxID=747089 RepID=U9U6B4_RHIID|nr:hypothetical protein RIR_jg21074.t1 [Rhizophagus irregularis DAOM 181602=DAOM 197198]
MCAILIKINIQINNNVDGEILQQCSNVIRKSPVIAVIGTTASNRYLVWQKRRAEDTCCGPKRLIRKSNIPKTMCHRPKDGKQDESREGCNNPKNFAHDIWDSLQAFISTLYQYINVTLFMPKSQKFL